MKNFLKSLFVSEEVNPEEAQKKEEDKKFELFKYDGIRAQNMGQLDFAVKCYRGALDIREDEEVLEHMGQALSVLGRLDEAFDAYSKLAEFYPDKVTHFLALSNVCFLLDKYDDMLAAAQKAIDVDGENPGAYYLHGRANGALKNEVMAVADYTKAISLREDYTEAMLMRADVLISMGQLEDAGKDLDAILAQNDSDEDALRLKGKMLESLGKAEEAETVYKNLIETDPFNQQAYLSLGKLYITQEKIDEAISLFSDAIDLNPNFAEAYKERGRAKLLKGDEAGSLEDGKKAVELNPKEADVSGQFENKENKSINILGID
jgi:tetratricopeptide (TPR) repeat protein